MTNLAVLPLVTVEMQNPRGDTWGESFQYFWSDGTSEIDLLGIAFELHLYRQYSEGATPLLSVSTLNFVNIIPSANAIHSILGWMIPDYVMKKLANAPATLDFRIVGKADSYRMTAMNGKLTLT